MNSPFRSPTEHNPPQRAIDSRVDPYLSRHSKDENERFIPWDAETLAHPAAREVGGRRRPCAIPTFHTLNCGHVIQTADLEPCGANCRKPRKGATEEEYVCLACIACQVESTVYAVFQHTRYDPGPPSYASRSRFIARFSNIARKMKEEFEGRRPESTGKKCVPVLHDYEADYERRKEEGLELGQELEALQLTTSPAMKKWTNPFDGDNDTAFKRDQLPLERMIKHCKRLRTGASTSEDDKDVQHLESSLGNMDLNSKGDFTGK